MVEAHGENGERRTYVEPFGGTEFSDYTYDPIYFSLVTNCLQNFILLI